MTCNHCGSENREGARFCAECSIELEQAAAQEPGRACSSCGSLNADSASFCAQCGEWLQKKVGADQAHQKHVQKPLSKKHRQDRKQPAKKTWSPALITLSIIGAGFAIVALLFNNRDSVTQQPYEVVETRSANPAVEAQVQQIASKFICSCGTCGEQPLETCTCGRAVEERQFIRNHLESGQNQAQIIAALNGTYGWIKSEFASLVDSTGPKPGVSAKLVVPERRESSPLQPVATTKTLTRIATLADRVEIYSHFRCPCGQCGIDELKDCTCSHPRGAKEVKGFIDQKIASGKLTIAQVVDEVNHKFGGNKF